MNKKCQYCEAFEPLTLQCRINPPVPVLVGAPPSGMQIVGMFPPTTPNNWCSKFIPIISNKELQQ